MASSGAVLGFMKLDCPSCAQRLNIPDHLGGKTVTCPKCKNAFTAPEHVEVPAPLAAAPAPAPVDDLALQPTENIGVERGEAPPIEFCPNCGAKWKPDRHTCTKCRYNPAVGRVIHEVKGRGLFSIKFDATRLFIYVLLAGLVYGGWWLSQNWSTVKENINTGMDRAARQEVTPEDQNLLKHKPESTK